ncbi:penicillin-binding protein activator [Reyranella sp.]|uniref:ABC transporter substrate-binding protein n=1 Tax=Reyranella sp. TaxID=1929291 RepID=UPI001210C486|nr:penicillin-binding protein activator [Reyranella sp.]TAJ87410.1 MAG: amino acid ABC transporter substrate-binding protein [Reyranella sp.]
MGRRRGAVAAALVSFALAAPAAAQKTDVSLPVLVPLTGFVALEGTSQRNGAILAERQIRDVKIETRVLDTQATPEAAVTAWERAVGRTPPPAVIGPILGTQMLALMPLAQTVGVPLLTVSGTARLSEMGNPYFFRFFPSDSTVKVAHARYVVEKLGAKRPAVIYQSTAYGQSGREQLAKTFTDLKAPPVLEESVAPTANDLTAALTRAKGANADVIVLHLHAASTVLAVRQARQLFPDLPVVAGSAMHQPATAALLDPAELKSVCAETAASPISATSGPMKAFTDAYRVAFKTEPDAFAAAQYDAVGMLGTIVADLKKAKQSITPSAVRGALSRDSYKGLVTTYKSDGKGNMAHEAEIVCFDGTSRVPKVVERYTIK